MSIVGAPANSFTRAQLNLFLPSSKLSTFVSSYTISSSFPIYRPILSQILSLLSSPSFPFLSSFPFFLPGKLEHFSYLPGSAATTLLLSPEFCTQQHSSNLGLGVIQKSTNSLGTLHYVAGFGYQKLKRAINCISSS